MTTSTDNLSLGGLIRATGVLSDERIVKRYADHLKVSADNLAEALARAGHTSQDLADWIRAMETEDAGSVWMVGDELPDWLEGVLSLPPQPDYGF